MTDSARTFQITLPTVRRKTFVYLALALFVAAIAVYWIKEIRPYVRLSNGTLQVVVQEIASAEAGKLSECLAQGVFREGQVLFSTGNKGELDLLQSKLDHNMQQYLYVQNELQAQIGPTALADQILEEIQTIQNRMAQLETASRTLAPFEGIVLQSLKQVGERVAANECVLRICDQKRCWVEAEIEEKMLSQMHPGLRAKIEFPAFPGKRWEGQVSWVSPMVESGKVKIHLTADQLPLNPGLSAKAYVKIR